MSQRGKEYHEYSRTTQWRIHKILEADVLTSEDEENFEDVHGGQENGRLEMPSPSDDANQPNAANQRRIQLSEPDSSSSSESGENSEQCIRDDDELSSENNIGDTCSGVSSSGHDGLNWQSSCSDCESADGASSASSSSPEQPSESSDDSEDDENDHLQDEEFECIYEPLYPGAPISLGESILSILLITIRHKLSQSCLADLLQLIFLHCIQPNRCLKSLYRFKKFFANNRNSYKKHFFCTSCYKKMISNDSVCPECQTSSQISYFLELPIIPQIEKLLNRPGFVEKLGSRFNRYEKSEDNLEDIFDGSVYKRFTSNGGFLTNLWNMSFTWNTDGISIFKSSKLQVWPFFLQINELPFADRCTKENIILAGIWFGSIKPKANLFLSVFWESFFQLYRGVEMTVHGVVVIVRAKVLCGTADIPARSTMMNMKQHLAHFGCLVCMIKTIVVDNVRVYPYLKKLTLRTTRQTIIDGKQALDQNVDNINGVKGPTVLSQIPDDFVETTAIDDMHCVYLGVVKKLLSIWFEYVDERGSLRNFIKFVNRQLIIIKPPAFVTRLPRSISDWKYWKAHELRNFLLYYSVPIFSIIMLPEQFEHHKLLVSGITLLSSQSVSERMIKTASKSLKNYVSEFSHTYEQRHMTCNLHLLLHLADNVRKFGPLRTTSLFPYENLNGVFKSLIYGTRYSETQICNLVSTFTNLIMLKLKLLDKKSEMTKFCERMELSSKRRKKLTHINSSSFILGASIKSISFNNKIKNALENFNVSCHDLCFTFKRLYHAGIVYDSKSYDRRRRTNSSLVKYEHGSEIRTGHIDTFVKIIFSLTKQSSIFAIVDDVDIVRPMIKTRLRRGHIRGMSMGKDMADAPARAIDIKQLRNVCFKITNPRDPELFYVIDPVNSLEFEQ